MIRILFRAGGRAGCDDHLEQGVGLLDRQHRRAPTGLLLWFCLTQQLTAGYGR